MMILAVALTSCDDATPDEPDAGAIDAGGGDAGVPFVPTAQCPGTPTCTTGDGALEVGAAAVTITPTIGDDDDVMTLDVDGDGEFEPADGDTFENRDGVPGFQGTWIAGFGNARPASGVHDEQWARAIALRSGDTEIVIVALDLIGYFKPEMDAIREMVADLAIDHIAIAATHSHQARDTIGIWGISQDISGLDPEYGAFVRERAAQAIRDAVADLRPANVAYAALDLRDRGPLLRWVGDLRDPMVIDPELRAMRFVETGTDTTIATLVNFGAHAEYMDDRNTLLSSDWPHYLREAIEGGTMAPDGSATPGLGGVAVFVQGAVGGQIGPNGLAVETWEGDPVVQSDDVYRFAQVVGEQLGWFVLDAFGPDGGAVTDETASLGFRTREFFVDVQNIGFHIAISQGIFDRQGENWDPDDLIVPGENEPDLRTEVSVIEVGRVTMITAPGELDPSLFLGGYDGGYSPAGVPLVDPENPNPPDLTMAPDGPYLRDLALADAPGGQHVWLLGLTNDFLGYFVPEYDFELDPSAPYLGEAPGDHYEETNSVGIDGWPTVRRELEALLAYRPNEG